MTVADRRQAAVPERAELDVLEQNARNLREEVLRLLAEFEARYELPSDRLESELAAGRLPETAEVSRWVILWRTLGSLSQTSNGRRTARVG